MIIVTPRPDRAVALKCQIVFRTGSNGNNITQHLRLRRHQTAVGRSIAKLAIIIITQCPDRDAVNCAYAETGMSNNKTAIK